MLDREGRRTRAEMSFLRGVIGKQTTDVNQAGGLSGSSLSIQMTYYRSLCLSVPVLSVMLTAKHF